MLFVIFESAELVVKIVEFGLVEQASQMDKNVESEMLFVMVYKTVEVVEFLELYMIGLAVLIDLIVMIGLTD